MKTAQDQEPMPSRLPTFANSRRLPKVISTGSFALMAIACIPAFSASRAQAETPPRLDPLIVNTGLLREEAPTGAHGEPEWVHHRRFSNTRVYIQKDPWEMGIETWYRTRFYDGGRVTQRIQQEFEIGLPWRMQLDLYEKLIHDNQVGDWVQDEFAVELRYAFADWGKLPGNPTLYLEYAFKNAAPDVLETKLLFGDDCDGWHWGLNLINAHPLWGADENEWAVAAGISRTLIDSKLSANMSSLAKRWPTAKPL